MTVSLWRMKRAILQDIPFPYALKNEMQQTLVENDTLLYTRRCISKLDKSTVNGKLQIATFLNLFIY